jgi:hypothetical protein
MQNGQFFENILQMRIKTDSTASQRYCWKYYNTRKKLEVFISWVEEEKSN